MISIEEARKILEDNKSSDAEIQETVDTLELMADLMFDKMKAERKAEREKNKEIKIENTTTKEIKTLKKKTASNS